MVERETMLCDVVFLSLFICKIMKNNLFVIIILLALYSCSSVGIEPESEKPLPPEPEKPQVEKTELRKEKGNWIIYRGESPYYIKGACSGGGGSVLWDKLSEYGGNSMRIYGVDNNTKDILDIAQAHGTSVMMGLSFAGQSGFDYNDATKCAKLIEDTRSKIKKYKNHPAVLAWAIGNEIISASSTPEMLKCMNDLSKMIHAEDPNHPTLIVTAGITVPLANIIAEQIPDIDFLGINYYAAISLIYDIVAKSNLKKPYVVTEWGVNGPWEVAKTPWGIAVEPSSKEKAENFKNRYANHIASHPDLCLGSYAFLWGQKTEGSPIWFGLSFNGEMTEPVDELSKAWTGAYPVNRTPSILKSSINGTVDKTKCIVMQLDGNEYTHQVADPDGDKITVEYLIRPENTTEGLVDDSNHSLSYLPGIIYDESPESCKLRFTKIHNEKAFRLYIFVRDNKGMVATEVRPLKVKLNNEK